MAFFKPMIAIWKPWIDSHKPRIVNYYPRFTFLIYKPKFIDLQCIWIAI